MKKTHAGWQDEHGARWPTPQTKGRLRCHQIALHAHLRDYVFKRDDRQCVRCTSHIELVIDHVVSCRNGGSHHPSNLQTLCKPCNDHKSNYEDRGRPYPVTSHVNKSPKKTASK